MGIAPRCCLSAGAGVSSAATGLIGATVIPANSLSFITNNDALDDHHLITLCLSDVAGLDHAVENLIRVFINDPDRHPRSTLAHCNSRLQALHLLCETSQCCAPSA